MKALLYPEEHEKVGYVIIILNIPNVLLAFIFTLVFYCVCVWRKKLCNCHYFLLFVLLYSKSGRTDESCLLNFLHLLSQTSVAQFGHTGETCNKYLLSSKILCVKPGHAMCFRENDNGGSKRAYKQPCKCYHCFSWCKVSLLHGNHHSAQGRDVTESYHCFPTWKLSLIHGNQYSQHSEK